MKNNYVAKRLISLALAVMLSGGALFTTALAATVTVAPGESKTGTSAKDVFYFNAVGYSGDSSTTVTDFNPAQDFISVNLPSGYSLSKSGTGTVQVAMQKDAEQVINLFTVIGSGVTADNVKSVAPDMPVIFGVTGKGSTTEETVNRNVGFDITPSISCPNGTAVNYAWKQNGGSLLSGITVDKAGKLSVPAKGLVAGEYTFTLTASNSTDTSKAVAWTSKKITVKDVCTPTFAVDFTLSPDSAEVKGDTTVEVPLSLTATSNITSDNCTYDNHENHGMGTPSAATFTIDPSVEGVNLASNKLVIDGSKLSNGKTTVTIKASITVGNVTKASTKSFDITKVPADCNFDPTSLSFAASPSISGGIINANDNATTSVTFNPTINGNGGVNCAHMVGTVDPFHGKTVEWEVTKKGTTASPAGVSIGTSNNSMTLTITKDLLASPDTTIVVKAYVKDKPTINIMQEYKITKTGTCNKTIITMGGITPGSVSAGSSLSSGVLTVNRPTATLQLSSIPNYSGTCDFESNGLTCPTPANHTVTWSITGSPSVSGISINSATGLLSVNYTGLTRNETDITVKVKGGTSEPVAHVIVKRGTLPSTGGGDSSDDRDDEEQKNSAAWDRVEFRIEDADNKDTIKVSMGDNIDMPTRVVRELIGENVTLELSVNGGFTWIINGKNLKKIPDYQLWIGLGVESIRDKDASKLAKYNDVRILELDHSGTFYGTYTLKQKVDSKYEGKYLYMYKYSDDANKLYYRGSAKVDNDGYVKFPFTSASTYVITDKALYGEAAGSTVGSGSSSGGNSSGGATVVTPPASSVAPPPASSTPSTSSSESSSSSSESASEIEPPSSSSQEVSRPADTEPEEPEEPEKKSIPLIIPILLAVVVVTVVAVILLAKGGMNFGG